ncbi:hypothetical protein EBB07_27645 [Paenibacillaceae bacterium]|nr:hypothetical protein EBB07_27645 [Paenibacillaceae bacterium]
MSGRKNDKLLMELRDELEISRTRQGKQDNADLACNTSETESTGTTPSLKDAEFEAVFGMLDRYQVAGPTDRQTKRLLDNLSTLAGSGAAKKHISATADNTIGDRTLPEEIAEPASMLPREIQQQPITIWWRLLRLFMAQVHLFTVWFWIASAAIVFCGAALVPFTSELLGSQNLFFLLAPLLTGASVLYSLRSLHTPMGGLEATFALSPAAMLIGRIGVVVVYDIGLSVIASIALSAAGATGPLLQFVAGWLVPLCFSTMLVLVLLLRFGAAVAGSLTFIMLSLQLLMREHLGPLYIISSLHDDNWLASRLVATLCTLVLGLLFWRQLRRKEAGG